MDVVSRELMDDLRGKWYSCGGPAPGMLDLDSLLAASNNTAPIPRSARAITTATDKLFYIYTRYYSIQRSRAHDWSSTADVAIAPSISGTTGAPKAALVSHLKFLTAGLGFVVHTHLQL